jgi:magnesium-transporting ATPase (P-type)
MGNDQMHFFCKGSPEMIQSLSMPETSKLYCPISKRETISNFGWLLVPENYNQLLESYTKQGFRVIALAHRLVESQSINKLQKVQREDLEHELTFLGMVTLTVSFHQQFLIIQNNHVIIFTWNRPCCFGK